jgi:1,4-dihydroxy-2-naphthoate octaprenyltransferase
LGFILRICDFIFVLRPVILIPAWSFYLVGTAEGARTNPLNGGIPSSATALSLTAILVSAYLLNQIFDKESDEKNNKCLFLARGIFTVRALVILGVTSFLSASYGYHHVAGLQKAPLLAALILAFAYSLPPLRLCARPFLDMLANAVGFGGIAFVLGFGVFDPSRAAAFRASMPYVLLVAATFLHTTILDLEGDRGSGKKSTTVLIGPSASRVAAVVLHASSFGLALWAKSLTAAVVTGVSFPVTLYALWRTQTAFSSVVVQANTLIVSVAAVVFWPAYLVVIVPLIALSRFYHQRRFGIIYPGRTRHA